MKLYLHSSIFFFAVVISSTLAYAQNINNILTIDVGGKAAIKQNDVATARDEAIQDALQKAIIEAAAEILSLQASDEKFQPVIELINDQADKYVNNYKITTEKKQAEVYLVNVNVSISLVDLRDDLSKIVTLQVPRLEKDSQKVFLNINGMKKYADFLRLKEFLRNHPKMVKNIYPCYFELQQAHLEVELLVPAQALADELTKTGRYDLDTRQIDKNKIAIVCLQKGGER
jgi:hypothetical protein